MPRRPWVLGDGDPVVDREAIAERAETLAAEAVRTAPVGAAAVPLDARRPPVLVLGGAGADVTRLRPAPEDLDLLSDAELARAADRAGVAHFDPHSAEEASLRGYLSALRGAAGEYRVLEQIESGELPVPAGTAAVELIPFTEPGVDLAFLDAGGDEIVTANVKIAATPAVVFQHLGAHPNVPLVYATSESAAAAAQRGITVVNAAAPVVPDGVVVVDIGATAADFDAEIATGLESAPPDVDGAIWFPWFSVAAIGVRAALRYRAGQETAEILRGAGSDAVIAGGGIAAGKATAATTGVELFALPGAIAGAWGAHALLAVRSTWADAARRDELLAEMAESASRRSSGADGQLRPIAADYFKGQQCRWEWR